MPGQMLGVTPPPISGQVIYSFEERLIGSFIDESGVAHNLYQKTINCGALPNAAVKSVLHNIANLDKVIQITGTAHSPTEGLTDSVQIVYHPASPAGLRTRVSYDAIQLSTNYNFFSWTETYVTLQYTCTDR